MEALIIKVGRDFPSTKEKESSGEEDGPKTGSKEEGELDEDAAGENSHHAVHTNGEEEDDDELLKSGKMDDGRDGASDDNAWLERDITPDLLHVIAKRSTGKLYRKLGKRIRS